MQTSFAEIPDALWERVERWIPKHGKSAKGGRPRTARRQATQVQARPAASLGGRARQQLAQQLPRAANPLGDEATHYVALVHTACAPIAYRAATRRNGHQF